MIGRVLSRRPHAVIRDESGVTVVEFAIVAPVMLTMLIGFFDLAHTEYARSVLQGSMQMAARNSTLETGLTSQSTIDAYVQNQVKLVIGAGGTYTFSRLSYADFSNVQHAEPYTDTNGNGHYDHGECYQDVNGNGQWDSDMGKTGQGGADDAVLYTVTVSYKRLFPMATMLGWPSNQVIAASTVLRNQPYGAQSSATPPTICT